MTSACCMCTRLFMRYISHYGFFTFIKVNFTVDANSEGRDKVPSQPKYLCSPRSSVLLWSLKTIHKVFTDFHIWLTRSLSLSLSPLFLHFLSRASSGVMFAAFISSSIRSIQCFFFSSLRTMAVARYSCWSVWSSCTLPPFRETIVVVFNLKTCF